MSEQAWVKIDTAEEAISWLEKAVAERGEDFKSQMRQVEIRVSCIYVWEGKPDCLIGVALHLAGWSIEELAKYNSRPVDLLPARFPGRLSEDAVTILRKAQSVQDQGWPWGQALENAKEAILGMERKNGMDSAC